MSMTGINQNEKKNYSLDIMKRKLFTKEACILMEQALAEKGIIVPMPYLHKIENTFMEIGELYRNYENDTKRSLF